MTDIPPKTQTVAILGFGVEGRSAAAYFAKQPGTALTIVDQKPIDAPPSRAKIVVGSDAFEHLGDFDVVVRSPSIPPSIIHTSGRVTSVTNEFLRLATNASVIGVTGSKGKGTTSSLIHLMLKKAGLPVHLAGNIGLPALDLLDNMQPHDIVVLELSSFQLWDIERSPHVAVVLMIEPEHLDVHANVEEYVAAKGHITAHQTADDITVYLAENRYAVKIAQQSAGHKIPYGQPPGARVVANWLIMDDQRICATSDLGIPGEHNIQNACAAITAAWQYTQDVTAIAAALREFAGLPHRLQLVAEVGGVRYYDDSIATTPTSAIAAMAAVAGPKVLILGGSDKGAEFEGLAAAIQDYDITKILLIGTMRHKIQQALQGAQVATPVELFEESATMADIVTAAAAVAQPGGAVILSPACASFDMFVNYKDRGEQFITAVRQLSRSDG